MTSKTHRIVSLSLAVILLLAACAPAPVSQPTQDLAGIESQIATAVAATISAQQTGTAAALPTASFTPETIPATETPILPTATPFVVPTSTSFSSGGGGGTTKPKYSCDFITRPRDNSTFHAGDDFDVKWTIINTGTATWPAGTDFSYLSGPKMTGATLIELPQMKSGQTYSVVFDAAAPTEKGFHVMTWKVQGGFCFPYVAIVVK